MFKFAGGPLMLLTNGGVLVLQLPPRTSHKANSAKKGLVNKSPKVAINLQLKKIPFNKKTIKEVSRSY